MAYASREELERLGLPARAISDLSDEEVEDALDAASNVADSYLNAVYQLPFIGEVGMSLKRAVCHIAALDIMSTRGFNPELADADLLVARSKDAVKWLEGVGAGKFKPVDLTDSSAGAVNSADLPAASRSPQVVQVHEADFCESDDFWSGGTVSGGGGVGPPRRRGW